MHGGPPALAAGAVVGGGTGLVAAGLFAVVGEAVLDVGGEAVLLVEPHPVSEQTAMVMISGGRTALII